MRDTEFNDPAFIALLRAGDAGAFRRLIQRMHGSLVGTASAIIGSRAQAEEVVQDAWLAVFSGIGRFEGRSSLISWVFTIVLNRARTRASREGRLVGLAVVDDEAGERAVGLDRFAPDGHWAEAPKLWDELDPERLVSGRQLWEHVREAIERLPAGPRAVIILRDIEGEDAQTACALLGITPENQRVLLHRARGRIRATIEALTDAPNTAAARAATPPRAVAPRPGRRLARLMMRVATLCIPLHRSVSRSLGGVGVAETLAGQSGGRISGDERGLSLGDRGAGRLGDWRLSVLRDHLAHATPSVHFAASGAGERPA